MLKAVCVIEHTYRRSADDTNWIEIHREMNELLGKQYMH